MRQEPLIIRDEVLNFKVAKQKKCIIKVIGVGGGGGNVHHPAVRGTAFGHRLAHAGDALHDAHCAGRI